jgi:replicative DNA helicase|tara:strand:+ start:569 stop:1948 length:1380 start_codon:yes stop_codon:yes gene_type:complete
MERIETTILRNLVFNEEYSRKVIPFIQPDYFEQRTEKIIFQEITQFIVKYGAAITTEALAIELENRTDLSETEVKESREITSNLTDAPVEHNWLLDTTEKWCRDRAIYLALMESIGIADGGDKEKNRDAIPSILSDALAVSFDNHIGHNYLEDYKERYESYHRKEDRIPFDLEYFNKITKGGLPNKTLNVALAGTGVGKSLFMCHMASSVLLNGRNVLYITMEMAEEKIAERIDANLLNVPIQDLVELPKSSFENKVTNLTKKTQGQLIIKEYPTASAHSGHFKALLNELSLKKSFKPDIIFVDYLNICASSRYKGSANINSYTLVKSIAEELRGLAVEAEVPIVSATQTTRSGYGSSDVDLTDTSESFGLPATADLMFALISTEELEQLGQIMVKQLKNRYNDPTIFKRFIVGIDRAKMRLYDCEQTAQEDILDSGREEEYNYEEEKKPKKSFDGFKF